jgi:hypothetical protein
MNSIYYSHAVWDPLSIKPGTKGFPNNGIVWISGSLVQDIYIYSIIKNIY